jgi:hypothetical protein
VSLPIDESALERMVAAAVHAALAQIAPESRSWAARERLVRVLVCDSAVGLDFATAALNAFAHPKLELEYLVVEGLSAGLTVDRVAQLAPRARVRSTREAGCPLLAARGAEAVVAATLDRPTALRVALTMPEHFGAKLLCEALCLGKPVVVATDGLGLDPPGATPQLRHALAEPVGRLEVFGATCVGAAELGAALANAVSAPRAETPRRPLITAQEVEAADGELLLAPDALVTPLALDRARELGVQLHRLPH